MRSAIDLYRRDVPADARIHNVLTTNLVERRLRVFDVADRRALRKQRRFRRAGKFARWAGLIGVIVVPLEVTPIQKFLPATSPVAITMLHFLVLILTFLAVALLGLRRSEVQWKRARHLAEKARARVFTGILRAGARAGELTQALACLRVAHLRRQMDFFESTS